MRDHYYDDYYDDYYEEPPRRRRRKKKRTGALLLLVLLLLLMIPIALLVWRLEQIPREEIDRNALERVPVSGNFTNIAVFGLDAPPGEEMGARSDTIMVASINNRSGEMRLLSVYRDTLMLMGGGFYDKANHAYAFGGPQEAVAMLNRNLDLDIEYFVTVNFNSLASIINILGGVEVELSSEELRLINHHNTQTAAYAGLEIPPALNEGSPGVHNLCGVQAVSFSRIRMTEGGDFRRAERQREVFEQVLSGVSRATPMQMLRIQDEVLPYTKTNMSSGEILLQGFNLFRMNLGEMSGYPFNVTTGMIGGVSYVIPVNTSENVRELHRVLFDNQNFTPSDRVQEISAGISNKTGVW